MSKTHALRYLLLKHLWKLRHHVPGERHREIATTLSALKEGDAWVVRWRDLNEDRHYAIPLDDVAFYVRGDSPRSADIAPGTDRRNEDTGFRFACFALGLPPDTKTGLRELNVPDIRWQLAGHLALLAAMVLYSPTSMAAPGLVLAALLASEYWRRKGKQILPLIGGLFCAVGWPLLAVFVNVPLTVLQFLDTDPWGRTWRVWAHICVIGSAAALLVVEPPDLHWDWWFLAVLAVASGTALVRWLHGPHLRVYPLVFPFACLGIFAEGYVVPSLIGLGGATLRVAVLPLPHLIRRPHTG